MAPYAQEVLVPKYLLLMSLLLCGCQTNPIPVEKPVIAERAIPPNLTITCPRQPAKPSSFLTINAVLQWASEAVFAGAECRSLSDSQGKWISTPPT